MNWHILDLHLVCKGPKASVIVKFAEGLVETSEKLMAKSLFLEIP